MLIPINPLTNTYQFPGTKKCERWTVGTADGLERMLGYPSIGPGIAIARKAPPKMPAHLSEARLNELSTPTPQGSTNMDTEEGDDSDATTEKRRKTQAQPLLMPDRSAEALEIVERERVRKYEKAYAERQEILAATEAVHRRNTAADLFFSVNAKIYIDEAAKLGTNLRVEVFEPVLDEEGDIKNMVMYMVAETMGDLPLEVKWWIDCDRMPSGSAALCRQQQRSEHRL